MKTRQFIGKNNDMVIIISGETYQEAIREIINTLKSGSFRRNTLNEEGEVENEHIYTRSK